MDKEIKNVNNENIKLSEDDIKKSFLKELNRRRDNNSLNKMEEISNKINKHNEDIKELSTEEQKIIKAKELKEYINSLSNKQRFQRNFLSEGYHPGFTKPTLKSRTSKRRSKNKSARIARRRQNR